MARAWSEQLKADRRQPAAWAFIARAVDAYVSASVEITGRDIAITPLSMPLSYILDTSAAELACTLGRAAASFPIEEACYQL